jgi:hypothetical protein
LSKHVVSCRTNISFLLLFLCIQGETFLWQLHTTSFVMRGKQLASHERAIDGSQLLNGGLQAQDQQDTENAVWWTCPVEQGTVDCMQAQPQVEQIDPCLWTNVQEIAGVWQPQLVQGLSIAQPQDQQQQPPAGQMMEQPGEPVGVQAGP